MEEKDLILGLHKTWWFSHQSPKTCKIGSDGVGHDLIHDADKLQAACRNAMSAITEIETQKEDLDLKLIDLEEMNSISLGVGSQFDKKREEIKTKRLKREINSIKFRIEEMKVALCVYTDHIKELLPKVSTKYKSYDDALSDVWASRIAYNALVKNHPLGHDLKIALMDESEKLEVLQAMKFPMQVQGNPLPVPNAEFVIKALEDYHKNKKELQNG